MTDSEEIREWYKEHRTPREAERIRHAKQQLESLGYTVTEEPENKCLLFQYKGNTVRFYPYKGWFTGKGIKDGRGIKNLVKQVSQNNE